MLEITREILTEIRSLEPFPEVAIKAMQIASREDAAPEELIEVIEVDAGLVGKVLKLCNSAYYGFQREIASIREAGNLLGVRTLVNLVTTFSSNRYFRDYGRSSSESRRTLWERSVATAMAARLVASLKHEVDADRAYTAGLLQNVGHVVLDRFLSREQDEIRQEVAAGLPLLQAEKSVLGLHHAELGARLTMTWNLPPVLVNSIRYHHQPDYAQGDPALAGVMHLAETVTWAVGYGEGTGETTYGVSGNAVDMVGLNRQNFDVLKRLLQREISKAEELVAA